MNNKIASPWKRLLAYLIDVSIGLLIPLALILKLSTSPDLKTVLDNLVLDFVVIILVCSILTSLFDAFLISTFGGNLGKILTGTKIVSSDGIKISFWRAFFRNRIGYMISGVFLWLGFIWVFVDKERRGWHDMAADTFVVTVNKILGFAGIGILALLVFADYSLAKKAYANFKSDSSVYSNIFGVSPTSTAPTIVTNSNEWISYKNTAFNYSLDHLSSWNVYALPGIDTSEFSEPIFYSPCSGQEKSCASVIVRAVNCKTDIICQSIDSKLGYSVPEVLDSSKISNAGEISIGGQKAYAFVYSANPILAMSDGTPIYNEYIVLINHNSLVYQITYREWGKNIISANDWQYKNISERMVNSFKFSN